MKKTIWDSTLRTPFQQKNGRWWGDRDEMSIIRRSLLEQSRMISFI